MVTRSQKVRLGIFVIVAVSSFLLTIGIIMAPKLFEVRDSYYVGYRNISLMGLQEGGPVKYHGLTVGSVSDIRIDQKDISRVIVEVSLEHGTPIKEDTRADVEILGITGIKVIELRSGTADSDFLKPGDFIQPGKSITETITGQAEVMLEKAELLLNNLANFTSGENGEKIVQFIENAANATSHLNKILSDNSEALSNSIQNMEKISKDMQDLIVNSGKTMKNLEAISGSDSLKQVLANVAEITDALRQAEVTRLVHEFNETLAHTSLVLQEVDATLSKNRSDFGYSIQSLRESVEYLNQFSRMITEDPSVLVRGAKPKDAPDHKLGK